MGIAANFAAQAYAIRGVEGVYTKTGEGDTLHIWTVVVRDDLSLRERLYDLEATAYSQFPERRLDFHVITLERQKTRDLSQALPTGFVMLPREVVGATGPRAQKAGRAQ